MASISPTITPLRSGASGVTDATSMPALTRRSAACPAVSRRSTNSRTHAYGIFIASRELLQEAQVVLEEQPQIVDAVLQHRDALDTHAERPAGDLLGVVAEVAQPLRMPHAGARDVDPAALFAERAAVPLADEAL